MSLGFREITFSFPSLGDCYDTFDYIFTPKCSSAQIDQEEKVHICGSSPAGDICSGDSGSGLTVIDKDVK